MKATDIMKAEHRTIERVLECLAKASAQVEAPDVLDGDSIRKLLEFFRDFADRCHHDKEEKRFFPVARHRGVGCPPGDIDILLDEHEQGRSHVRAMAEALSEAEQGDASAKARFRENARQYIALLSEHIRKEDDCLFPTADNLLTADDQESLTHAFEAIEREEMGTGTHERLHALADELCKKWSVPTAEG
ncbi:MAG: hypothetical protein AMXMBFR13_17690 [Phycisphaerae bacterium]